MYVADAIAMPVHWYYNIEQLKKDYGSITGYTAPHERFEGNYMALSDKPHDATVGENILHDKRKFYNAEPRYHYHTGMVAGENTLEPLLARLLTRQITADGEFIAANFAQAYADFMQQPGSHNDAWAATAHRMFFSHLVAGKPLSECTHKDDSIDALTVAVPIIVRYVDTERDERN